MMILFCGFVLGAGVTVVAVRKIVEVMHTPGEVPKRIARRMQSKLNLTHEQAAKVRTILVKREKAIIAHFLKVRPKVQKELTETREEVSQLLTPELAKEWQKWFDHHQRRWQNRWFRAQPTGKSGTDHGDTR